MKPTTFLISPVRGIPMSHYQPLVERLEETFDVYWPARDTNQIDKTGLTICQDNLKAMKEADMVHVIWNGKSQGSLFDLGMAFSLGKDIVPLELPSPTSGKSFQNMIIERRNKRPPVQIKPKTKTTIASSHSSTVEVKTHNQEAPNVKPATKKGTKLGGSEDS